MGAINRFKGIVPLSQVNDEALNQFDCGKLALNLWLSQRARSNEASGGSRTYVLLSTEGRVAGFYCISNYSIAHTGIRAVIRRNMPNPIPAVLLGRLAVSRNFQGQGIGRALLRHAIENSIKVSKITGSVLLVTEAIDEEAENFYLHAGFSRIDNDLPYLAIKLHDVN